MNNTNIVTTCNALDIYNKTNDAYKYNCPKTGYDWIFASNNKLYIKISKIKNSVHSNEISIDDNIKTNNEFKHLKESNYDQHIIYYEDDDYKIAIKESEHIYVLNTHNNEEYCSSINNNYMIYFDEITKIDNDKYFIHTSLNTGVCIQIIQGKIKKMTDHHSCLKCSLDGVDKITGCKSENNYCYANSYVVMNPPLTLLYGNHIIYILCTFFNCHKHVHKFVSTKIKKNINHSDEYNDDIIIFTSATNGLEKIINKYKPNDSFPKYFSRPIKNLLREPCALIYHNEMNNNMERYAIHLNIQKKCPIVGIKNKCHSHNIFCGYEYTILKMKDKWNSYGIFCGYDDPQILFNIHLFLYPLGIIHMNVQQPFYARKHYIFVILLIDGSYHECVVDIDRSDISTFTRKKIQTPHNQLLKINNEDKFQVLCQTAKIQLKIFLLTLKRKKIRIPKPLVRNIMECSLL